MITACTSSSGVNNAESCLHGFWSGTRSFAVNHHSSKREQRARLTPHARLALSHLSELRYEASEGVVGTYMSALYDFVSLAGERLIAPQTLTYSKSLFTLFVFPLGKIKLGSHIQSESEWATTYNLSPLFSVRFCKLFYFRDL